MNERLHPLTLGEVLDRTAQLYRSRFLVYAGIAIIPAGTVLLSAGTFGAFFAWAGATASKSGSIAGLSAAEVAMLVLVSMIAVPVWIGLTALGWGALTEAATRDFLGEAITIRGAYRNAWSQKWRYLGLCVLMALIAGAAPAAVFGFLMLLIGAMAAVSRSAGPAVAVLAGAMTFLGFVAVGVYVVWMLLRMSMAFPACVVENVGPWHAIKRSAVLSRGTKGRIVVLFLLVMVLSWVATMALMLPMIIGVALMPGAAGPQHTQTMTAVIAMLGYGLSFAVQVLIKPIYGIALSLFYFDQRIRTEGFDIEWMMREAGLAPEAAAQQPMTMPWLAAGPISSAEAQAAPLAGPLDAEPPKAGGLA